jgi:DNA-binding FrmR family transcriptional regulator
MDDVDETTREPAGESAQERSGEPAQERSGEPAQERSGEPAQEAAGEPARRAHEGPHGYSPRKGDHVKRLRRIEGQVRGLQRMVEQDEYCIDILTQVSASTKALQSFALSLLEDHLRHCVADAVENGGPEADDKVAEATAAIARLLRT